MARAKSPAELVSLLGGDILDINGGRENASKPGSAGGDTGFFACVFNLANVAMGAGVLAFPGAFEICGFVIGPVIAVLAATLMCMTLQVVARCSDEAYQLHASGKATVTSGSYQEIVVALLGRRQGKVMTWLILIYLTLSNVAYITIMFDQTQPIIASTLGEDSMFNKKEYLVPLCGLIIGYPLALIPNMKIFAIPSTASQFGIIFAVGVVAYYGLSDIHANRASPSYGHIKAAKTDPMNLIESFPLIAFSFQCHITFPLIYASMKDRTVSRVTQVNITTIVGCLAIYMVMGLSGYLLLGEATPGDILVGICGRGNYYNPHGEPSACCMPMPTNANASSHCPEHAQLEPLALVARAFVFIKVACSYGMLVFVARTCVQDILMGEGKRFSRSQHHLETIIYVAITIMVGVVTPTLTVPMEFAGILVVVIDIFYPGLMQMKIATTPGGKLYGWVLIGLGFLASCACVVSAAAKL